MGQLEKETSMTEDDDDIQAYVKPWVGLTDEEREELMDTYDVASTDYAQAIEAKLKEKNA
jgi:hypothetical protein